MNGEAGPKARPASPHPDRLTSRQPAALFDDPSIRALAAHLRDRATMRQAAQRAAGLAAFLEIAHRRGEAIAAEHIAAALREALR